MLDCSEIKYDCSATGTETYNRICLANQYIIKAFLAVYMMLAAVLMLNLLVAVFSNTYANLESSSEVLWKWQLYDLMKEFRERSSVPIPFSAVIYCTRFLIWIYSKALGSYNCCPSNNKDAPLDNEHERIKFGLLEAECRGRYLQKQVEDSEDKVVQQTLRYLQRDLEQLSKKVNNFDDNLQNALDSKITDIVHVNETGEAKYISKNVSDSDSMDDVLMSVEDVRVELGDVNADMSADTNAVKHDQKSYPYEEMLKTVNTAKLLNMGKRSRKMEYPNTNVKRSYVKKEHWDWKHPLIRYKPVVYSDPNLPPDLKLNDIPWNAVTENNDRRSYEGRYMVQYSLPLNPVGRTGLSGRGQLPRWGPNFIAMPIITRFARRSNGERELVAGKYVFEVLLQNAENGVLTLPEVTCNRDEPLPSNIRNIFSSSNIKCGDAVRAKILRRIGKVFNGGVLIYRGYSDSEVNTDNSWVEAIVVNYHDTNDNAFHAVSFKPGSAFRWSVIRNNTPINNSYRKFIQRAFYIRSGYDHIQYYYEGAEGSSSTDIERA